jgi:hypothetical protein
MPDNSDNPKPSPNNRGGLCNFAVGRLALFPPLKHRKQAVGGGYVCQESALYVATGLVNIISLFLRRNRLLAGHWLSLRFAPCSRLLGLLAASVSILRG